MEARYQAVQAVLIRVLIVQILLAVSKLALGWHLGSLSVLTDGIHSFLDGASSVIAMLAIIVASRPPDENHPYGHRKFEVLATFALSGLLLLTCWELLGSAVERLRHPVTTPEFSWWGVLFLTGTLGITLSVSQYEKACGERLNSPLLIADALHTRSDFFSTLVALIGVCAAHFGVFWLDPVAAIVIVLIIGRAAYLIIIQSISTVADENRLDIHKVRKVAERHPKVQNAHAIRSHGMENDIHLDLHIRIDKNLSARQVFDIENQVAENLKTSFPGVTEVSIRHEPSDILEEEDNQPGDLFGSKK
ncbi:MAG: cation diffusion facilitator family transporter [Candidatus Methylacidiphilales bacterium]